MLNDNNDNENELLQARRNFMAACGKFAIATPPAISVLLASTASNYAAAASGLKRKSNVSRKGNGGNGGSGGAGGRS
jgi:hypothetical protein